MRIINRGIPPNMKPRTVECRSCKSEIEFFPSEVARVNDQRDGDYFRFNCPVCSTEVTKAVRS